MDHGPNLVDNNIFLGSLADIADNSIYVHNLFVGQSLGVNGGDGRMPYWFAPHTFTRAGTSVLMTVDNKYFNNIHAGGGTGGSPCGRASPRTTASITAGPRRRAGRTATASPRSFAPGVSVSSLPNGVTVTWKTDSAPTDVACPLITRDFLGPGSITKQGIENHDGTPHHRRSRHPGQRAQRHPPHRRTAGGGAGDHTVTLLAGPTAPLPGTGGTGTGGSGGTGGTGGTGGATGVRRAPTPGRAAPTAEQTPGLLTGSRCGQAGRGQARRRHGWYQRRRHGR
jgi:hypothetical protein